MYLHSKQFTEDLDDASDAVERIIYRATLAVAGDNDDPEAYAEAHPELVGACVVAMSNLLLMQRISDVMPD